MKLQTALRDCLSKGQSILISRDPLMHVGQTVRDYALKIRALSSQQQEAHVSAIGQLFLDLPDREATRWLLHVEAATSMGHEDPWRLSRESAAALVAREKHTFGLKWRWFVAWPTIYRLSMMGLLNASDDNDFDLTEVTILPLGAELLQEVASGTSPFAALAEAMTRDDVTTTIDRLRGATDRIEREGAREAANRWARMVAHEIRNALVPAQGAWDLLREDVSGTQAAGAVERYGGAITKGLERVFRFVKEVSDVAAMSADPAAPFEVIRAIHDAAIDLNGAVRVEPQGPIPALTGHRSRFSLAVRNLLQNALQAGAKKVIVGARSIEEGEALEVTIDDDGPGVPEEHRAAIFEPGFSTRPEGTGQGLTFVREVIERELGGRVSYQASALGGASFTLRIPLTRGDNG